MNEEFDRDKFDHEIIYNALLAAIPYTKTVIGILGMNKEKNRQVICWQEQRLEQYQELELRWRKKYGFKVIDESKSPGP